MPKGGVNELLKTGSGKKYLGELQKRYWKELLQPSDPRFNRIYGKQIERSREMEEKNKRVGQEMYEEQNKRKEWEQKNQWRTR